MSKFQLDPLRSFIAIDDNFLLLKMEESEFRAVKKHFFSRKKDQTDLDAIHDKSAPESASVNESRNGLMRLKHFVRVLTELVCVLLRNRNCNVISLGNHFIVCACFEIRWSLTNIFYRRDNEAKCSPCWSLYLIMLSNIKLIRDLLKNCLLLSVSLESKK